MLLWRMIHSIWSTGCQTGLAQHQVRDPSLLWLMHAAQVLHIAWKCICAVKDKP
jgi:hypothetical protein